MVKMAAVEFGSVARRRCNFDANFLAFTSRFNRLVIHFNVRDDPNAHKLTKGKKNKANSEETMVWNDWPTEKISKSQ